MKKNAVFFLAIVLSVTLLLTACSGGSKTNDNEGGEKGGNTKETVKTGQEDYINSLLGQIELLKSELNKKDDQINNTLRLLENSQVLIKDNKEKILMLESKEEKEKKGFFSWFKN